MEMNNVYDEAAYAGIVSDMKAELSRLREYVGDTT
ncbi:MAG: hypothetical protein KAY65_08435 [Planctomycetes bacterium]|nr:hypothetical protein [Planctomycetota bacterium]